MTRDHTNELHEYEALKAAREMAAQDTSATLERVAKELTRQQQQRRPKIGEKMPLDLDGLFQEGVDVGRAESAAEIARLRAALEQIVSIRVYHAADGLKAVELLVNIARKALAKEGK